MTIKVRTTLRQALTRLRSGLAAPRLRRTRAYHLARSLFRFGRVRIAGIVFARGQLDTAPTVGLDELGIGAPGRKPYEPSGWLWIKRALRGVCITPADVFVDYGSGMGRAVYLAARHFPFGRVIGVELSADLNEIAKANLERMQPKLRCKAVEIVTCDAVDFVVPDDMTYAYLYNPFQDGVFRAVLDNIVASLDRRPRTVTICYANPVMADVILASGRFDHVRTSSSALRDARPFQVAIFKSHDV